MAIARNSTAIMEPQPTRLPRVPRGVLVECKTDRPFGATLVDISGTGCLLQTAHLEDIATRIALSVMIPIPEEERVLDDERVMTDFASIYARAKARLDGGTASLGIQCITLSGNVVRQERNGEEYYLGVHFRWLARRQRRDLDSYLASLPAPAPRELDGPKKSIEPVFKIHISSSEQVSEKAERGEMTKIRFVGDGPVDTSPLSAEEAKEWIDDIDERDLAFLLFLRALRRRASHASVFIVKGSTVYGRMAISQDKLDKEEIQKLKFPLAPHSPFRQVATSGAFFVGPLRTESEEVTNALRHIGGGEVPSSALLIPIFILDRLVAITVAHSHERGFPVPHVPELLGVADATSDAAYRYLLRIRADQQQESPTRAVQPGGNAGLRRAPDAEMVEIFARIESGDLYMCKTACSEAVARPQETLEYLDRHFPGALTRPRDKSAGYVDPGSYGPVLGLVTLLGAKAMPLLATKMGEADADMRYFATLCAVGVPGSEMATDFVERSVEEDSQIRALALMALSRLPADKMQPAMDAIRELVDPDESEHLQVAADALVYLGDTAAASLFVELLEHDNLADEQAGVLQRSLVALTCQDFGVSPRRWARWVSKNRSKSRAEWLLDGLEHKNPNVRQNAIDTLRRLTGLKVPFDVFSSRSERSRSRNQWSKALAAANDDDISSPS